MNLLQGADIQFSRRNRLDIALSTNFPLAIIFLPASDIPRFVGEGNIDLGITGQDVVAEAVVNDKIEEILQLGFGKCRLSVQIPVNSEFQTVQSLVGKRIATSFEVLARKFFEPLDAASGLCTQIDYLSGSVEAACALGLADGIVDLVESGDTMKAAGLHDVADILHSEAVLIQSRQSKHTDLIAKIAARLKGVIAAKKYVLCNYNIQRSNISKAVKITPGRQAPTITSLDQEGWCAISSMVLKADIAHVMDELGTVGATDIIVFTISNCRV
jgi:ATP phosphoribosyltransferase